MEEKLLKELTSSIKEIKEKLDISSLGRLRGPIADPIPDFAFNHAYAQNQFSPTAAINPWRIRGPIADPVPWELLDKTKIAKLRIRQLDMTINDLKTQIDLFEQEKKLLKEEYKM